MDKKPAISVCMPMYNASAYLHECIDSILCQTFADFELLVVDDGSEDGSIAVVESYTDPRIRLIRNKHDFIASLNLLLQEARGKYIARMDADDVMMPDRLEKQFNYMEEHPDVDILGGAILCFGNSGSETVTYNEQPVNARDLFNDPVLAHPAVMMRAESVSGILYEPEFIYVEDFRFWCQALRKGLKMLSLPDVVIKYRVTASNICSVHKEEQRVSAARVRHELEEWVTASEARFALPSGEPLPETGKSLTAIIAFLNEGDELAKTVSEIRRTVGEAVDIIVINDCSFDGRGYHEELAPYGVHYIVNRHRLGVAASRDLGVSLCQTPYFLFLDAHMRFYDSNWANRIVEELRTDDRQLLCCQGRFLHKDEKTGIVGGGEGKPGTFGAYSPFETQSIWPDITWSYKETNKGHNTQDIPTVLGAAYAASKSYWKRLLGLKGLHNYGADEQLISFKVWLEGGRCTLLKDVVVGHIYRKESPYRILGRDSVYNLLLIGKLLFPAAMYSETVATALVRSRDHTIEALKAFKENEAELARMKAYLDSIFVRKVEDVLPMHQACREIDEKDANRYIASFPQVVAFLHEHAPADDGLMYGKMGVLLWLSHYEEFSGETKHDELASSLYSSISDDIKACRLPWNFRHGLAGIGWGLLYLLNKGFIDLCPNELLGEIDKQLIAISPKTITDMSLETGASGILAYLTLRLTSGCENLPKGFPLEEWYALSAQLFMESGKREELYYSHLFCTIYKDKCFDILQMPLLGIWLNAPSHLPKALTTDNCTLADGVLGTTLKAMSLLTKRNAQL